MVQKLLPNNKNLTLSIPFLHPLTRKVLISNFFCTSNDTIIFVQGLKIVVEKGFEPIQTEPKTVVLPLHHSTICRSIMSDILISFER